MAFKTRFKAKNNADFTCISCWKVRRCRRYLVSDSGEDHGMGHQGVGVYQALRFRQILHRNPKHELMIEPARHEQVRRLMSDAAGRLGDAFAPLRTHTFMSLMPSLPWKCFSTSQPNHTAWEGKRKPFQRSRWITRALLSWPAYLALLDGLGGNVFEKLDGLVVVHGAAGPDHVAEELDGVQLPVRILGSGVIHEADLVKEKNFWNGIKQIRGSAENRLGFVGCNDNILCLRCCIRVWRVLCRTPAGWGGPNGGSSYPCPGTPSRSFQAGTLNKRWPPERPATGPQTEEISSITFNMNRFSFYSPRPAHS